ncbi:MAG: transporter substrate-binding domain-containing protein [Phoenicibacter congonensis]|uniref:Transporter substrate-binding domain-containing protein n=1 Tax=Phoenicibacter congonensis TaxID=1944646 RepID=A0AA43RHM8_9ACTN|nr:transporter substrate-binding domain-containing protein [Phoenicibacter congonensis]
MTVVSVLCACAIALAMTGCSKNSGSAPELKSSTVTSPTIGENGTLRVGVNTSLSPLAGMGNSKIIGIDVDLAAAVADSLGLKLQIVDTGSSPAKAIANGTVDVAFGVENGESSSGLKLTSEYIPTATAIFKLKSSNASAPTVGSTTKIAAQASSKSAWSVTNTFSSDSLVSSSDIASAFQSLKSGEADYVAADAVFGTYAASKAEIDVEIVAIIGSASGYSAAVAESNTELYSAVSAALTELTNNGTVAVIQKKWLGNEITLDDATKLSGSSSSNSSSSSSSSSSTKSESSGSKSVATDANSV